MSEILIGSLGVIAVVILIGLRVPVGIALMAVSTAGITLLTDFRVALSSMSSISFELATNWTFSAVPMFLFMGFMASESGITHSLFSALRVFLSRIPGGLAVASVGASAMFSAASGSSVATTSAMSRIAVPEMLAHKYHPSLATGAIAASGTLGALIPPSIVMLIYGVYAQVSIAKLFVAGIIPGILTAFLYASMIVLRSFVKPELAPRVHEQYGMRDYIRALGQIMPLCALLFLIIGGIFAGIFTPTEAGAVGALMATVWACIRRSLSYRKVKQALEKTVGGTASIFIILVGTVLFTRFLALSELPMLLSANLIAFSDNGLVLLAIVAVLFLLLGMFIDSIGLLMLTMPFILPVARDLGVDLIWFGIIVVKFLEVGLITPPVGLNVYVIKGALGERVSLTAIFAGAAWFIATDFVAILMLVAFPVLVLFLPGLM